MENYDLFIGGKNIKLAEDVKMLNTLVMAFVGDSVYSTYIKTHILDLYTKKVNNLTKDTAKLVNASAQKEALFKVYDILTEDEKDIVRRARNSNIHTKAKNYTIEEYRHATAFEALIGYLYLSNQIDRIKELFLVIFSEEN